MFNKKDSSIICAIQEANISIDWRELPFEPVHRAVVVRLSEKDAEQYKRSCIYGYAEHLILMGVEKKVIEKTIFCNIIPSLDLNKDQANVFFKALILDASYDRKAVLQDIFEAVLNRVNKVFAT